MADGDRGEWMDQMQELLVCFICKETVNDALMCSSCSAYGCRGCLDKWVRANHSCPICRTTIAGVDHLASVRFINNLKRIVSGFHHSIVMEKRREEQLRQINEARTQTRQVAQKCAEHDLEMNYYCSPCQTIICSDCKIFGDSHREHKIERISSRYQHFKKLIDQELEYLQQKQVDQQQYLAKLRGQIGNLKDIKERKIKVFLESYKNYNAKLDKQIADQQKTILKEIGYVNLEQKRIGYLSSTFRAQLESMSQPQLIQDGTGLIKKIREVQPRKKNHRLTRARAGDICREVFLPYHGDVFVLRNYSSRKRQNEIVFSKPLEVNGIRWRLKIYPNGSSPYKGQYLSIFVEMMRGWSGGGQYSYKVILARGGGSGESIEREYVSDFETSICWGYNRFCKLEDLISQGYLDTQNDQIVIKYMIRPSNHFQLIRDQQNFIRHLEETNLRNKIRIFNSRHKNRIDSEGRTRNRSCDMQISKKRKRRNHSLLGKLIPESATNLMRLANHQQIPSEINPDENKR